MFANIISIFGMGEVKGEMKVKIVDGKTLAMQYRAGGYVHENHVKSGINVSPAKLFFSFPKRKFCAKGRRFVNTQNKKFRR